MQSIIVFSHLRWNFVFQRPQHLMTRLAEHYRIVFVEEPERVTGSPHWKNTQVAENILVCTPQTTIDAPGFHDAQLPVLKELLGELVEDHSLQQPMVWLYTPMALPLVGSLGAKRIVYDCMDELSAFKNAPRQLIQREHALLKTCDLVLAGGPSLFKAKRARHHAVHCFPSSVDREHFAVASDSSLDHPSQAALAHPRLGFFGVIDERLDIELIAKTAVAHPDWQIVLVGPVVKIDPASLPKLPNIHYYGPQPYSDLPKFLAGWDVCLLPFALNEATRFISPTKTLEYMAADKAIVSTPVTDVAEPYSHVVRIAEGEEFIRQCQLALTESTSARQRRIAESRTIIANTSWALTVQRIRQLLESPLTGQRPALADGRLAHAARSAEPMSVPQVVDGANLRDSAQLLTASS